MGYTIIFETKFVKLSDGRLLHLDRSGCNNDNSGRDLSDFSGEIYTEEELKRKIDHYMKNKNTDGWELKIGSRTATYYDYGEHLSRMAKRAVTFEQFTKERYFEGERFDGVQLFEPEDKFLTAEEFEKVFYDYLYGDKPFAYTRKITRLKDEQNIVQSIENKEPISFYVGKKYKIA